MIGPVSVYTSWRSNTHELLERRTAEISPDCEKAIGLNQPNSTFRADIAGSINFACGMARLWVASDPEGDSPEGDTREPLSTVPPVTVQDQKDLTKLVSRKPRRYESFDFLVKCLANAYWDATGKRPSTHYRESDAQGGGAFWSFVEIVLPVASEVAIADGIKFPYASEIEAREMKIRRILKAREHLYQEAPS